MREQSWIIPTYKRWPVEFVTGLGANLIDKTGRSYIDMLGGIAVASVGHANPKVARAIADQAARLVHVSNLYFTEPQERLAERLAGLTGGALSFFCNSGAEAVEAALKLARRWGGGSDRRRIIAMNGGFHGRTFGAMSATGQPAKQEPFLPVVPGFTHVDFGDAAALEEALGTDVAAVILEPIQGEAGVILPPDGYLGDVRAACDRHGALLILDEIQTGFGRTGSWFAHRHWGVSFDVMCLAKALAGGLPMGACLATPEVAAAFQPGDHASTFGGGPVQSAAALAVIDVIESEGLIERSAELGEWALKQLREVFDGCDVRGKGLMIGIELPETAARDFATACLERGLIVNDATPSVVRLTPPLVIQDEDLDRAVQIMEEVWREVSTA